MSVVQWCKLNAIDPKRYYYWLSQLRKQTLDNLPELANINFPAARAASTPTNIVPNDEAVTFKKLEVQTPLSNMQAAVIVHLPSATLEVTNAISKETVGSAISTEVHQIDNLTEMLIRTRRDKFGPSSE